MSSPQAGINAPLPLQLRLHVLVMQFIGDDGVAAPRLKDAGVPPDRMRSVYTEMVLIVRTLYQVRDSCWRGRVRESLMRQCNAMMLKRLGARLAGRWAG